jgi:hypothetical protein
MNGRETTMRYLCLIYGDESQWAKYSPQDQQAVGESYAKYTQDAQNAGVFEAGEGLQPTATATTVRVRNAKTSTTDGPFAETKEQLGGFYLLNCKDLDAAVEWASKIPGASGGSVEIRPVLEM